MPIGLFQNRYINYNKNGPFLVSQLTRTFKCTGYIFSFFSVIMSPAQLVSFSFHISAQLVSFFTVTSPFLAEKENLRINSLAKGKNKRKNPLLFSSLLSAPISDHGAKR